MAARDASVVAIPTRIDTGQRTSLAGQGTPARMSAVICVARLDSRLLRRDPGGHGSELRVIWLQQRFAFPIENEALAQIRAIEWERQARSYRL